MGDDCETSRIYVGNLPNNVEQRDIEQEFSKFGKIIRCDFRRTMSGANFCFIEYDDPRDARDAINDKDGREFEGARLRVEIPFNARDSRGRGPRRRGGPPRKGPYVVEVTGLPSSGSWQDLKDHMREAGDLGHADVFKDGTGEVSFFCISDLEKAIEKFDGSIFRSHEGQKTRIVVREKYLPMDNDYERSRYRSRSPNYRRYGYSRRSRDRRDRSYSHDRSDRRRRRSYDRDRSRSYSLRR